MDSNITIDTAQKLVKTKANLYQAMIRNKWFLPSLKSSIISESYLSKIRDKELYCPLYEELNPQPCPTPPTKQYLIKEVISYAKGKGLELGITDKKNPNKDWLIQVLSILKADHCIFKKDYIPPIKQEVRESYVIDNSDNFFTGLPQLYKKADLKKQSKLKTYKTQKLQGKIKMLKNKKAKIEQYIVLLGDQMIEEEKQEEKITITKKEYLKMKDLIKSHEVKTKENLQTRSAHKSKQ